MTNHTPKEKLILTLLASPQGLDTRRHPFTEEEAGLLLELIGDGIAIINLVPPTPAGIPTAFLTPKKGQLAAIALRLEEVADEMECTPKEVLDRLSNLEHTFQRHNL